MLKHALNKLWSVLSKYYEMKCMWVLQKMKSSFVEVQFLIMLRKEKKKKSYLTLNDFKWRSKLCNVRQNEDKSHEQIKAP